MFFNEKYHDLCPKRQKMKVMVKRVVVWGIPVWIIGTIWYFRWFPGGAEWYARHCYPLISNVLSSFSSLFPFSIGDCFIVGACLWLILYPVYAWWQKEKAGVVLRRILLFMMWIYIWFYLAWGINYFRLPFYERTGIAKAEYSSDQFQDFLREYLVNLNQSYKTLQEKNKAKWYTTSVDQDDTLFRFRVGDEIIRRYQSIANRFGMVVPERELFPKPMLWSKGMSMVGVSGYMGPFFSEFNLNREVLNVEYPFTYAHELAHRLGIASESEANLYAACVTCGSFICEVRFSGYFSLLGYVMNNARQILSTAEYRQILEQISPEIIMIYEKHLKYWRERYNPKVGKIQNKVYNTYLKGNQIGSGIRNYSEVVGLLISLRQAGEKP